MQLPRWVNSPTAWHLSLGRSPFEKYFRFCCVARMPDFVLHGCSEEIPVATEN